MTDLQSCLPAVGPRDSTIQSKFKMISMDAAKIVKLQIILI